MLWRFHIALSLDRHKPFAACARNRDVPGGAKHVPTVAVTQPAELGQKHPAIDLVDLELLGVGIAKAVRLALLLEAREVDPLGEEILVRPLKVLQSLLQGMNRRSGKPACFGAIAPGSELLRHSHIANELFPGFVIGLLHRQRLVEHKAARSGETTHEALLSAVWL